MARRRRIAWIALLVAVVTALLALLLMWAPTDDDGADRVETPVGAPADDEAPEIRAGEPRRVHVIPPPAASEPAPAPPVAAPTPSQKPRLSVTVRTDQGDAVPGATVELRHHNPAYAFDPASWRWSAQTGDDGAAEFEAPMRGHYEVRARLDGLACLPAAAELVADESTLVVTIGAAVPVSGVVLRRNGTPVPDASVTLSFHSDEGFTATLRGHADERGRFAVDGVRETMLARLDAEARAGRAQIVRCSFMRDALTFPVHLVLRATDVQVTGRVVDTEGEPLARASVVPRAAGLHSGQLWVQTGVAGSFTFSVPAIAHDSVAVISHPGRAAAVLPLIDTDEDGVVALGDIVLGTGEPVSGRVVREDGSPAGNVPVSLTPEGLEFALISAQTDDEGRFTIPCVGAGPHDVGLLGDVVLRLPGAPERTAVHAGDEDVRVVFHEPTRVRLKLLGLARGHLPRVGVTFLEPVSGRSMAAGEGPQTGLLVLGSGTFDVRIDVQGYAPVLLRGVRIAGPDPMLLEAQLKPGADR